MPYIVQAAEHIVFLNSIQNFAGREATCDICDVKDGGQRSQQPQNFHLLKQVFEMEYKQLFLLL